MRTVGFIGLGTMGAPMAANLDKAGFALRLFSRSGTPSSLDGVGTTVGSPREVAAGCDTVILMLPETAHVQDVLFGANGLAEALEPGTTVVDMSTISPVATRDFATRIAARGCSYVDAPVSGGEVGARAASLSIMCGGEQEVFDRILPLLQAMGQNISLIGAVGAGQIAKLANQMIVAITIEGVAEALLMSARAGVDPEKVRKALLGGFASSRILEVHGERMTRGTFNPGFRLALHLKDMNLAAEQLANDGLTLPLTQMTRQQVADANADGMGQLDHSALMKFLEAQTGFTLER